MKRTRVLILGAAGRDFHNFNVLYRADPQVEVIAFTAQQIPNIADRRYPPSLAGHLYPKGIAIHPEERLERLIAQHAIDRCVMAYSDVAHEDVMHLASRAGAAGADFEIIAARRTMLRTECPVVAVCATRTGAGKSQTSRAIVARLRAIGLRVGVIRHPMPYGDLERQRVQRFATAADLDEGDVTIEEREEYEPHLEMGSVVWAGVDYEPIVRLAEREADVLIWDGGNNDTSFLEASVYITIADPHRAGDELRYHPGETNLRLADVVIINKTDTADGDAVARVRENVARSNRRARVVLAASPYTADDVDVLRGRHVLAIEDGPTLTHGGMALGVASLAARDAGATLVDPRTFATGEIAETLRAWPHLGPVLPALGYGEAQVRELERTLAAAAQHGVEAVAVGTPIDLASIVRIPVPHTRVRYELRLADDAVLDEILEPVLAPLPH